MEVLRFIILLPVMLYAVVKYLLLWIIWRLRWK
jgi:hypothetical protein